ncbi:ribokinase [Desulforamulus hydrothermalis]|uniref:Ribokinase n=1 Tax=Desulforamulus hydrothermalis Lam5 = DSM 18033 TaxID=1121428 RepID=K8DYK5_9FIRM|nr:ribokinase [Desulforamulus hydrothermalis]CCO07914.1 putative sugar kinase [Desulforamulus hydrothermalis Lam5 = DSM 18033]SHH34664.1 ribokinase [Desulforamulus hydrothermalis Lam5 = DSM 18033]
MKKPRVLVVGSINMDLVGYTRRIPGVGETVLGQRFVTVPGGKGANQAVAAARLGGQVQFIGAVGSDSYGDLLLQHFKENGVDVSAVKRVNNSTGVALITVDANGNNNIVVVPGANFAITPRDLEQQREAFAQADVVVLQLEIPMETVGKAIELANSCHKPVILNPAPAQPVPEAWLGQIDFLVPNEHEVNLLGGSPDNFYANLRAKLKHALVVTQGEKGVTYAVGDTVERVAAFKVQPVDTTAAGDAFIGGLSIALAEDLGMQEAVVFASAVAALSVTREGAQTSLPYRHEVEALLGGNS